MVLRTITHETMTPADLLAKGLGLPGLSQPPRALVRGTTCAITGQPIETGYPVAEMVTDATAEFLDCFRGGMGGWVSESAARCFKSADPRMGNPCARSVLIFEDGAAYLPMIARQDAEPELPRALKEAGSTVTRPVWSDLVRAVWPSRAGQRTLAILTTDTKKRLWIRARVGALGPRTPLLYYDGKTAGNQVLLLDWPALLACLNLIEEVYELGYPKTALSTSLYSAGRITQAVGLAETRRYERQLVNWRNRPEFRPALLMAQRAAAATREGEDEHGHPNN